MSVSAKRVCITGAAGQIGYALTFAVARGDIYGPDTPVILVRIQFIFVLLINYLLVGDDLLIDRN